MQASVTTHLVQHLLPLSHVQRSQQQQQRLACKRSMPSTVTDTTIFLKLLTDPAAAGRACPHMEQPQAQVSDGHSNSAVHCVSQTVTEPRLFILPQKLKEFLIIGVVPVAADALICEGGTWVLFCPAGMSCCGARISRGAVSNNPGRRI
jgi:hypothetical protein